jgi:hypothetical protein
VRAAAVVKRCGCGREYSRDGWEALEPAWDETYEDDGSLYYVEFRNCACGSTIGVEVELGVPYGAEAG